MNNPMLIWLLIAAVVAAFIIVRVIIGVSRYSHHRHEIPIFEIGEEHDEVWIPGDRTVEDDKEASDL